MTDLPRWNLDRDDDELLERLRQIQAKYPELTLITEARLATARANKLDAEITALRKANQEIARQLADEEWRHAACLSIAENVPGSVEAAEHPNASAAMRAVRRLRVQYDALRERD